MPAALAEHLDGYLARVLQELEKPGPPLAAA
jgi:hypothetical protein